MSVRLFAPRGREQRKPRERTERYKDRKIKEDEFLRKMIKQFYGNPLDPDRRYIQMCFPRKIRLRTLNRRIDSLIPEVLRALQEATAQVG